MDTTNEYIKMCKEAKDIQDKWEHDEGDFYAAGEHTCKDFTYPELVNGIIGDENPFNHKCACCERNYYAEIWWLPRQDQLQDMLSVVCIRKWAVYYERFINVYMKDPDCAFRSTEQAGLGFVMEDIYGKVWNGETWVKLGAKRG